MPKPAALSLFSSLRTGIGAPRLPIHHRSFSPHIWSLFHTGEGGPAPMYAISCAIYAFTPTLPIRDQLRNYATTRLGLPVLCPYITCRLHYSTLQPLPGFSLLLLLSSSWVKLL